MDETCFQFQVSDGSFAVAAQANRMCTTLPVLTTTSKILVFPTSVPRVNPGRNEDHVS